jgi:hypothetical protein
MKCGRSPMSCRLAAVVFERTHEADLGQSAVGRVLARSGRPSLDRWKESLRVVEAPVGIATLTGSNSEN